MNYRTLLRIPSVKISFWETFWAFRIYSNMAIPQQNTRCVSRQMKLTQYESHGFLLHHWWIAKMLV